MPAGEHGPLRRASWASWCATTRALGVKHYEVWNEPNQYFWWKPKPQPARYAEMVRKAYVQAKLADPSVTIVAGAMALVPGQRVGHDA